MMTSAELIPAAILKRKAVVYVRQSTQSQVMINLESKRRQYDLVHVARQRGFVDVEIIDDDLGRSASGTVARPGFDRLVAWLCAGKVGAVLCFDASRLARNGRDWHHLLELCGLVEARVIDLDGVYNPCRRNDRLLLGMKGSISEFELGVLRARMLDAARSKASRGELRISVPFGYIWHREVGLGLDPDLRLQEVIRLIFVRFRELGSARQVLLSMKADQIHFPRPSDEGRMTSFDWMPIRYRNVIAILKNPFYAGVYVYGKSEKRTAIVEGRARRSYGHGKPIGTWEVMIKDHHEGYIGWAEYERNLRVRKPRAGEHGCATTEDALAVMRSMAGRWSDEHIAASLNRMGLPTGQGKTWTAHRVSSVRRVRGIHAYRSAEKDGAWLTMTEAAKLLGVTNHTIRHLIKAGILSAVQVVPGAPYQIRASDLESELLKSAIARKARPCRSADANSLPMFPDT